MESNLNRLFIFIYIILVYDIIALYVFPQNLGLVGLVKFSLALSNCYLPTTRISFNSQA